MLSFSTILTPQDVLMTIQDLDKKILKTVLYLNCQGCNRTKIKHKKGDIRHGYKNDVTICSYG